MTKSIKTDININYSDCLPVDELLNLKKYDHLDRLTIQGSETVTTAISRLLLKNVQSIGTLSIWQTMTRTALRDCFALPNLHTLEVLELTTPGKVIDASQATCLRILCTNYSTITDLKYFFTATKYDGNSCAQL